MSDEPTRNSPLGADDETWASAAPSPDSGAIPPPQIGRYRILRVIGQGGMGTVYEAGKFPEAEPLLSQAYEELKANAETPQIRQHDALGRIVRMYEAWGKPKKAAEWRHEQG